jgi:hypothetical protein
VNPLSWLSPTRWLLCAGLLLALWAGYEAWADHQQDIGDQRATARYELALAKQRTEAATKLATVTAAVRAKELALNSFRDQQETLDAKHQATVAANARRLAAAVSLHAGQLRDPNAAAQCGGGSGSAGSADPTRADHSADDPAQTGGLFSAAATRLLQRILREADEIDDAYASCRTDALQLRELQAK